MIFAYIKISLDGFHLITKHHLRREKSVTACMVLKIGVHSVCSASQKLLWDCLLAKWIVVMKLLHWSRTASPSEKRIPSYSSQHGDKGGCSFSLYCKFELNLRLFAIWLNFYVDRNTKFSPLGYRATWAKSSQLFLTAWWWRWMYT